MKYKGEPLDYAYKILMNSLYGKFAQKNRTKKLVKWDHESFKENYKKVKWTPYIEELGIFEIEEERIVQHRAVFISAIITSLARICLYKYFLLNPDHLIYCDTDSIHSLRKIPDKYINDKELGFLKLEVDGERGCYIGRKQYVVGDKLKFKGVPLKSNLKHDNLTFDDYVHLLYNGNIEFNYNTFPALKTVLKRGKKACKMMPLKRKIKKADYLTNFKKEK